MLTEEEALRIITAHYDHKKLLVQFEKYLSDREETTRRPYISTMRRFLQDYRELTMENVHKFLGTKANVYTFNNSVKALKHFGRMLGSELPIKLKPFHYEKLIIAPKKETVIALVNNVGHVGVRCYLMLCATTGIRVQRLLRLGWRDLDLENGWVLRSIEHRRTKTYRPNPIHREVLEEIQHLERNSDRVFDFGGKVVRAAIRKTGLHLTPTQLRDFFYNEALGCGMNPVTVEYMMGHDIGISKHYLGDNIKKEYVKFEETVRIKVGEEYVVLNNLKIY